MDPQLTRNNKIPLQGQKVKFEVPFPVDLRNRPPMTVGKEYRVIDIEHSNVVTTTDVPHQLGSYSLSRVSLVEGS